MATILEQLCTKTTGELISIWNNYASEADMDDYIYDNEDYEINEIFCSFNPSDIVRTFHFGDYRYNDPYFYFNGYGKLVSFEWIEDSPIYLEELSEYIIEHKDLFKCYDLDFSNIKTKEQIGEDIVNYIEGPIELDSFYIDNEDIMQIIRDAETKCRIESDPDCLNRIIDVTIDRIFCMQ